MTQISDLGAKQRTVCERFGAKFVPVEPGQKLGIALSTLSKQPLNALRHPPEHGTCGWYIWGGELSEADDFFQSLHAMHLDNTCPKLLPYLRLAPGWRVLLADTQEDVWFDEKLLVV